MNLRRQKRAEALDDLDMSLPLEAAMIEELWGLPESTWIATLSDWLDLPSKYHAFRSAVVAEYYLTNINECSRLKLDSNKTSVWLWIAVTAFSHDNKKDAIVCLDDRVASDLGQKLDETEVAALIDALNISYFQHFNLMRYCMKFERRIETLNCEIEMGSFQKTPKFAGAAVTTTERARAAFRRAANLRPNIPN